MERLVGFNNNVVIIWTFLTNDGDPYPLDGVACKLFVHTGKGKTEVKEFCISGEDNNIVSWEMNITPLRFLGNTTLEMNIYRQGRQVASVLQKNILRVIEGSVVETDENQVINISSFVNRINCGCDDDNIGIVVEDKPAQSKVSFEVDNNMHLIMHETLLGENTVSRYNGKFKLHNNGHLIYKSKI